MKEKEVLKETIKYLESICIDMAQHLREQHGQQPNDSPRVYFENMTVRLNQLWKSLGEV